MILSGNAILKRLENGQIFREGTWDQSALKEASYALRLAPDGLMIEGEHYEPGEKIPKEYIEIKPGKIAILSTIERLNMPSDLVGKIGIRLDQALLGVTGLMGIQVDPLYGYGKDERLFVRVANLGNESVRLSPCDQIFTFELHEVKGDVSAPAAKEASWKRIKRVLAHQNNSSWTYVTRVESDFSIETQKVRDSFQPVVMFGVFLVAVTILGVAISLILGVRDTPQVKVPIWVTDWGWILLLFTLSAATIATAFMVGVAGVQLMLSLSQRRGDGKRD